jgi:O-antigen ligase
MGARMEFWYNSLQIIQKAPLLGFGVAGFETEYKKIAEASHLVPTVNPHNQYLLFLCQIGIVGLLAFLYLNYVIWKESARLVPHWRIWVRALILGYAAANLFNSMLLDVAEGIFFSASLAIAFAALLDGKTVLVRKEV